MKSIHGTNFAKATHQAFSGQTTHLQQAAEAQNADDMKDALFSDKFSRSKYDEFSQYAATFLEHSETKADLNSDPLKVSLLNASHKVTYEMAKEAGVGVIGLAWGFLRGFDKVVEAPEISGMAVLRDLPEGTEAGSALDRIESLSVNRWIGSGFANHQLNYQLNRNEGGQLVMTTNSKTEFYGPDGQETGRIAGTTKVEEGADGRLTAERNGIF